MLKLGEQYIIESIDGLKAIPDGKVLINTINAHSYNTAQKDSLFAEALQTNDSDYIQNTKNNYNTECVKFLIPDGASIIKACRWIKMKSRPIERIAGWDLFVFEMQKLNERGNKDNNKYKVMFMGASETVLSKIKMMAAVDFPNLNIVTYSPPYKPEFSDEDSQAMIDAINKANPDLLWIGMTAPKQEKWTYKHWDKLNIHCHVGTIGAVFDFYAGTSKRAPLWWQQHSLEWLYRLIKEPKRMWKRYLIGNPLFIWNIMKEAIES